MAAPDDSGALLGRTLASGRIHSAYLVSGDPERARDEVVRFARGVVCRGEGERPCHACADCRRSSEGEEVPALDGTGKKGPLLRHVGDHPDLLWVERGEGDTRVRIGQVRALKNALRFAANEGGWRVAVVADAEWLNQEAQNALLRLLEEPPERTCLVLVAKSSTGLLTTIRSRCQRVDLPGSAAPGLRDPAADEDWCDTVAQLDQIGSRGLAELLDWAEAYRGERAGAAARVHVLLSAGSEWLRERVRERVYAGETPVEGELRAFRALGECRKDLDQRNANPQMVAERALFRIREALSA